MGTRVERIKWISGWAFSIHHAVRSTELPQASSHRYTHCHTPPRQLSCVKSVVPRHLANASCTVRFSVHTGKTADWFRENTAAVQKIDSSAFVDFVRAVTISDINERVLANSNSSYGAYTPWDCITAKDCITSIATVFQKTHCIDNALMFDGGILFLFSATIMVLKDVYINVCGGGRCGKTRNECQMQTRSSI